MSDVYDWTALAAEALGPCSTCNGTGAMTVDIDDRGTTQEEECAECAYHRDPEIERIAPILERIVTSGLAYTIGRRDGLACARQQGELVRDILRAALDTWVSTSAGIDELKRAVAAWDRAGQPGLPEGE